MQKLTYDLFLEKFKREKTTDDCYTPENVYEAVLNWCVDEYGIDKKLFFVRGLDNQKQYNKNIFGAGFIMAQDTTKNYLEACNKANKNNETKVWKLSDREKKISWTL